MLSTVLTVFVASLLGSVHCAFMCGGLVSFTCGTSQRPVVDQMGYHVARFCAYTGLGAVAGYIGHTLNQSAVVLGVQNAAAWFAGVFMLSWALWRLLPSLRFKRRSDVVMLNTKRTSSRSSTWFAWLQGSPNGVRGALLGLTTALLPCGWLYAFLATATGQGSAWGGAAVMAAFALGSVPILLGVGGIVRKLSDKARQLMPQLSAIVLLVLGLTTIVMRAPMPAFARPAAEHPAADRPAADQGAHTHHSCH